MIETEEWYIQWDDETEKVPESLKIPLECKIWYVIRVEWPEEWTILYFDDWNDRQKMVIEFEGWLPYETYEVPDYKGPLMTIIEKEIKESDNNGKK